jgi:hypothetical protein|tara:strand:+ start:94214 stop:94435 length:222 start_codon:yes stop_codon:yes gene_type:complete
MFNLYANAIDADGFMGLVSNNVKPNSKEFEIDSRKIISGFAIISLLILSVITSGSQSQLGMGQDNPSSIVSIA